jgi:hypothetical protein
MFNFEPVLNNLREPHGYKDSVVWQLDALGLLIGGSNIHEISGGQPATVRKIWSDYKDYIVQWAEYFSIPVELIIATIATESGGKSYSRREEPGYISDINTPDRVSTGLMQTLISTACGTLKTTITGDWLLIPENSIRAGTSYITDQTFITQYDPPKVACAYNAGALYYNGSPNNRWKMRQYPIGSSTHADRFVKWFNDCFLMFDLDGGVPNCSFYSVLNTFS